MKPKLSFWGDDCFVQSPTGVAGAKDLSDGEAAVWKVFFPSPNGLGARTMSPAWEAPAEHFELRLVHRNGGATRASVVEFGRSWAPKSTRCGVRRTRETGDCLPQGEENERTAAGKRKIGWTKTAAIFLAKEAS